MLNFGNEKTKKDIAKNSNVFELLGPKGIICEVFTKISGFFFSGLGGFKRRKGKMSNLAHVDFDFPSALKF